MNVLARWWCCAEYGRTGRQHDGDCEYALLGDRADVLVQVKAECARLVHQHRGAVDLLRRVAECCGYTVPGAEFDVVRDELEIVVRDVVDYLNGGQ